jgi:hypothetical protein
MISFAHPKSPFRLRQALLASGEPCSPTVQRRSLGTGLPPRALAAAVCITGQHTVEQSPMSPLIPPSCKLAQPEPPPAYPGQPRTCPGHRLLRCPGSAHIVRHCPAISKIFESPPHKSTPARGTFSPSLPQNPFKPDQTKSCQRVRLAPSRSGITPP